MKMWWDLQTEEKKNSVRKLIKNGQLLIVNGGMSAPDEATTNYEDIIDNFMAGHRFIHEELQVEQQPSISWQVDSFGVSSGYARLAKDLGFDAMFFSRIDYDEKMQTIGKRQQIKVWRPSEENFGNQKDVLSILMTQEQGQYCWPTGFGFDQNYHDQILFEASDPKYGDPKLNGEKKMEHLRRVVKTLIDSQDSDNVYLTYGCDFSFTQAEVNYYYLDKVMKEWNKRYKDVELIYSNPKNYLETVK